jgi:hypothetical protein
MFKNILLPILLVSSAAFTERATNEKLTMVLSNAIDSRKLAVSVEPNIDGFRISRDYFYNIVTNIKMLKLLEAVRNNSNTPIEGIVEAVKTITDMMPSYDQLIANFDLLFVLSERHGTQSPEVEKTWEKIAPYFIGFFTPVPDTAGLDAMQNLLLQLQK